MAVDAELTFWTVQLQQVGGNRLLRAPMHPEMAWLDAPPVALALHFTDATRRRWCEHGLAMPWVEVAQPLSSVAVEQLAVEIPGRAKPPRRGLDLRFHVMVAHTEAAGWYGFVPALGVGAQADDRDSLLAAAGEAVMLELARNERLLSGQAVLATQWFTDCAPRKHPVAIRMLGFSEVRDLQTERKRRLLPLAAHALEFAGGRHRAYDVDERLGEIERAMKSPFAHCLLLVGPSGVGKTALLEELVRRRSPALGGAKVWGTTAARLVRTMTMQGGWQEHLDRVCTELREQGDWLFVRNLAELFEVGRYIGNDISMAEHLRPRLERGELSMVTECTPEQVARLEARHPGYLQLFTRIELVEPDPPRLERILRSRLRADATDRVATRVSAVREALRLLRRFAPYSGFPGRPVRFLEALVLEYDEQSGPVDGDAVLTRFCAATPYRSVGSWPCSLPPPRPRSRRRSTPRFSVESRPIRKRCWRAGKQRATHPPAPR